MLLIYFILQLCTTVTPSNFSNAQKGSRDQAFHLENRNYRRVPREDLARHPGITSLLLQFNKITVIRKGDFPRNITQSLVYINLRGNDIEEIEEDAFSDMPNLHVVDLNQNYLTEVPKLKGPKIRELHLRHNKIRRVEFDAMQHYQNIEHLDLKHNDISAIYGGTFRKNKRMVFMVLSGNPLHLIEETALVGPTDLQFLYLEQTELVQLPSTGVEALTTLDIRGTRNLISLPDPAKFIKLTEIFVEYSMHCCAFIAVKDFPKLNNTRPCPNRPEDEMRRRRKRRKRRRIGRRMMNETYESDDFLDLSHDLPDDLPDLFKEIIDSFDSKNGSDNTTDPCKMMVDDDLEFEPLDNHIKCSPEPDEFNPCEDVMGTHVLRVFSWFISIFAVIGNIFQLVILFYSRQELSVYKLLMYNLGFSNLLMGIYLLVLCCVDGHTYGRYYNFAQSWQYGGGCKSMGMMALFATQLSVCSLLLITIERFLLIIFALEVQNQMKLKHAVMGVFFSWLYSFIVAGLPLTDTISSYTNIAICLPMSMKSQASMGYVLWLLLSYVVAFLLIVFLYVRMYKNISDVRPGTNHQTIDIQVAKRMSMIIFSNFLCWLPISLAGMMAMYSSVQFNVGVAKFLLVFIFPLNACTNPFLYAIFTKVFRGDTLALLSSCGLLKLSKHRHHYDRRPRIPQTALNNFVRTSAREGSFQTGSFTDDSFRDGSFRACEASSFTDSRFDGSYRPVLTHETVMERSEEEKINQSHPREGRREKLQDEKTRKNVDELYVKIRSDSKRGFLESEITQCRDPRFRTESTMTCSTGISGSSVGLENDEEFSKMIGSVKKTESNMLLQ